MYFHPQECSTNWVESSLSPVVRLESEGYLHEDIVVSAASTESSLRSSQTPLTSEVQLCTSLFLFLPPSLSPIQTLISQLQELSRIFRILSGSRDIKVRARNKGLNASAYLPDELFCVNTDTFDSSR